VANRRKDGLGGRAPADPNRIGGDHFSLEVYGYSWTGAEVQASSMSFAVSLGQDM
jgi:hypothetical protein